ncbi:hypothetical protein BDR04DRAFT_302963 [Suillus decipiens]|nr:hypothetical protein BDR04DRAFT_302963 [Suillus decipiens]
MVDCVLDCGMPRMNSPEILTNDQACTNGTEQTLQVHVHGDAKYVKTTLTSPPEAAHSEPAGRIALATLRFPQKARIVMSSAVARIQRTLNDSFGRVRNSLTTPVDV